MPQQTGTTVTNNFANGLVTEATGLNFPENACTETYDCVFNIDGSVERREGIDFETNYSTKTIDTTDGVICSYLWRDVAGDGSVYLYTVQVGNKLVFYDASTTDPVSAHAIASYIDLTDFSPSGAPEPKSEECQFSSGNGLLFVTHPFLEAFYVAFDSNTQVVTGTQVDLQIRDFKGIEEAGVAVDDRPFTSLSGTTTAHHYNLLNQGWTSVNLTTWDAERTDLPSNCDVMWSFKNSDDAFDMTTVVNVDTGRGNSPAPKGHFVLDVFDEDRATPTGLAISNVSTGYARCATNAFFAGRVFYAGVSYTGYNSNIYFTQIVERNSQYGACYQTNDPTSNTLFDLLPSDGGVIVIRDAGTILKLLSLPGGLIVFASNGIWMISGSVGLGFTATDYSVSKISSVRALTHTSFVDIAGNICWWNLEGIYVLSTGKDGVNIKSMTHDKLLSFFYDIPPSSKRNARGFYNSVSGIVQWLYRSTEAGTTAEMYQFDRILNFNTFINAFYPWTISESDVKVSGLVVVENLGGAVTQDTVIDDASETIVTDAGETVIVYSINDGIVVPKFKYLVYYNDTLDYFTIAEERDFNFTDFISFDDVGVEYASYFTSGYRLRGEGIRKYQPLYLKVYSENTVDSQYYIKGLWDYATSGNTGRWSPRQLIVHDTDNYSNLSKRIKIRGHGATLQFKVESIEGEPFHLIGWSEFDSGNARP